MVTLEMPKAPLGAVSVACSVNPFGVAVTNLPTTFLLSWPPLLLTLYVELVSMTLVKFCPADGAVNEGNVTLPDTDKILTAGTL